MNPTIISLSLGAVILLILGASYLLKARKQKRISSPQGDIMDNSALFILPRPPDASSHVESKINWVLECSSTLDKILGSFAEGHELITKDSVESTSDNIRLLAYHYDEYSSLVGTQESRFEHGKMEIRFSSGNRTAKAFLTYLWEFFCCGYDLIYTDKDFRAWAKREDIPRSTTIILLRILLLILVNSYESDQ